MIISWVIVILLLVETFSKSIQVSKQRYKFLAFQFWTGLSHYFLYPTFAELWPFRDYFTSVWKETSCENSSRGLTSLKGGLTGKWLPSTWNTWKGLKMLLANNSPHPEKGQLTTILGWSVSCHINTQCKIVVKFPICKWPEGTLKRYSLMSSTFCTWHKINGCLRKCYFRHSVFSLVYLVIFSHLTS